jgi:hypothetical protein
LSILANFEGHSLYAAKSAYNGNSRDQNFSVSSRLLLAFVLGLQLKELFRHLYKEIKKINEYFCQSIL